MAEGQGARLSVDELAAPMGYRSCYLIELVDEGNGGGQTGRLLPDNRTARALGPVYRQWVVDQKDQAIDALAAENARLRAAAQDLISFGPPVARVNDNTYICIQCGCGLANWKPFNEGMHAPDCAWDALRSALGRADGEA